MIDSLLSALSPPPGSADQLPPPKRLKASKNDLPDLLANPCLSPQDEQSDRSQLWKDVLEYIFEVHVASQVNSKDSNRRKLYVICEANIDDDDGAWRILASGISVPAQRTLSLCNGLPAKSIAGADTITSKCAGEMVDPGRKRQVRTLQPGGLEGIGIQLGGWNKRPSRKSMISEASDPIGKCEEITNGWKGPG